MGDERNYSEALNRPVDEWLHRIRTGQLRLPSFQRGVAWDKGRTASMLNTIVQDLPLGITLILDVGDIEKFHSRPLESAPANTKTKVTEHLLDGQQRLTALWRALKDNSDATYFVRVAELDDDPNNDDEDLAIEAVSRWMQNDARFPLWADHPEECRKRGLVPVKLLDPNGDGADAWVNAAYPAPTLDESATSEEKVEALLAREAVASKRSHLKEMVITPLRERVKRYNLPYLRLPASTDKDVALRVFINMNTNAKPLRAYDIVVAELESATDVRLRDKLDELNTEQPALRRYFSDVGDAVLQVSALMQGKQPNQKGYHDLDYATFVAEWGTMAAGLRRLTELLTIDGIVTSALVPSGPPLPVAAALLAAAPDVGDARASADQLVRRYLWSAFFTTRYQSAAATRASADFTSLRAVLDGTGGVANVPVLTREQYPLPTVRDLLSAGWPKKADRLGRAILAASNYFGARDFADDTTLTAESRREYHHLFPDALLKDAAIDSFLALNCALITWKTNRTIGRLDPIKYLEQRAEKAPDARDVEDRLATHLVPYSELASAGPYVNAETGEDLSGESLAAVLRPDFDAFLLARARLISAAASSLADGKRPHLRDVLDAAKSAQA